MYLFYSLSATASAHAMIPLELVNNLPSLHTFPQVHISSSLLPEWSDWGNKNKDKEEERKKSDSITLFYRILQHLKAGFLSRVQKALNCQWLLRCTMLSGCCYVLWMHWSLFLPLSCWKTCSVPFFTLFWYAYSSLHCSASILHNFFPRTVSNVWY